MNEQYIKSNKTDVDPPSQPLSDQQSYNIK